MNHTIGCLYCCSEGSGLKPGYHNPVEVQAVEGCKAVGWNPQLSNCAYYRSDEFDRRFDAIVMWSVKARRQQLLADCEERGIPSIVIEMGGVRRDLCAFHIGLGPGLWWLPPLVPDSARLDVLGLTVKARRGKIAEDAPIVICGQLAGDSQHNMTAGAIKEWAQQAVRAIRKHTKRPIIWRPHPLMKPGLEDMDAMGVDDFSDPRKESLRDAVGRAHAMVTWNSSAAWDTLAMGVPVFCQSSAAYARAANTTLAAIGDPEWDKNRVENELSRLSYATWLPEELQAGKPFRFLADHGYLIKGEKLRCS